MITLVGDTSFDARVTAVASIIRDRRAPSYVKRRNLDAQRNLCIQHGYNWDDVHRQAKEQASGMLIKGLAL